jgi:hypothetical protein
VLALALIAVRLDGPVRGRSGVRRDLRADLARARERGVGCVVCCLDDAELALLGAPWAEYAAAARALGLAVWRAPTPEGLAPRAARRVRRRTWRAPDSEFESTGDEDREAEEDWRQEGEEGGETPTIEGFDRHLAWIIDAFTRRGVPVLVHCRGGVGRAGVLACCWAIRLGLVGWLAPASASASLKRKQSFTFSAETDLVRGGVDEQKESERAWDAEEGGGEVRRDALLLVERAIALVRRRRSVKAVETYEQVRFLLEYVEYLRARSLGLRE